MPIASAPVLTAVTVEERMTLERVTTGAGAEDAGVEGELAGVVVGAAEAMAEVMVSVWPALTKVRVMVIVEVEKRVVVGWAEEPAPSCSAAQASPGRAINERRRRRISEIEPIVVLVGLVIG